jgi:hypothetical protein
MHWARAHVDPVMALRTLACANRWTEAWPRITARLRAESRQRRHSRRQASHPAPAPPCAELTVPTLVGKPRPSATTTPPRATRAQSIINGTRGNASVRTAPPPAMIFASPLTWRAKLSRSPPNTLSVDNQRKDAILGAAN